ncbi:MAG: hypothetical protein FWC64_07120 [Treponema sp.]|nr:hypothetical protein [Treponema sp.]
MNTPLITELLEAPANAEKVRNQIAALLSLEFQNQHELAKARGVHPADYDVKIYVENSRPYDTAANELISRVNVILQDVSVPKSNPRIGSQAVSAKFEIYCIANGNATGDFRDDKNAAFRAWKIMRLVWGIIMSEPYTYLGMRGVVTNRAFTKMEAGTPGEYGAQAFSVIRASLDVQLAEGYFGGPSVVLEGYNFDVFPDDGQIVAAAETRDLVTGINNHAGG